MKSPRDSGRFKLGTYILDTMVTATAQVFPKEDLMDALGTSNLLYVQNILLREYTGMFRASEFGYVPNLDFVDGTRAGFIEELAKQIEMKKGFVEINHNWAGRSEGSVHRGSFGKYRRIGKGRELLG